MGPRITSVHLQSPTVLHVVGEINWEVKPETDAYATFGAVVSPSESRGTHAILACGWSPAMYESDDPNVWSADLAITPGATINVGDPVDAYGLGVAWEPGVKPEHFGWPNELKIQGPLAASS
jgi:hypothetical protein